MPASAGAKAVRKMGTEGMTYEDALSVCGRAESDALKEAWLEGNMKFKRFLLVCQARSAEGLSKADPRLLIHLGKHYLAQGSEVVVAGPVQLSFLDDK